MFLYLIEAYATLMSCPSYNHEALIFQLNQLQNKTPFCFLIPLGCYFSVMEYTTEVPMNSLMILYLDDVDYKPMLPKTTKYLLTSYPTNIN